MSDKEVCECGRLDEEHSFTELLRCLYGISEERAAEVRERVIEGLERS